MPGNRREPLLEVDSLEDAEFVFDFEGDEFDLAWDQAFVVKKIGRGIGYCNNHLCPSYLRAAFIFQHAGPFRCPECLQEGKTEAERGKLSGPPGCLVGIVEMEYCFEPASGRYREKLILRDESLGQRVRTYTAFCPLLNNEKRATRAAEGLLAILNDGVGPLGEDLPFIREKVLSFDVPLKELRGKLLELELQLRDNPFYTREAVVSQSSVNSKPEGETGGSQSSPADRASNQEPRVQATGAQG